MTPSDFEKLVSDIADEQPYPELAHESVSVLSMFSMRLLEEFKRSPDLQAFVETHKTKDGKSWEQR